MIDCTYETLPVRSPHELQQLESALSDPQTCNAYIQISIGMWEQRFARLTRAAETGDEAALMDVTLSIKSSSEMLGLLQLAALADQMKSRIQDGDLAGVFSLLPPIEACGRLSMRELQQAYPA